MAIGSNPSSGDSQSYSYTGGVQSFTIPANGIYKLEVWGAKGGAIYDNGGKGGYSIGYKALKAGDVLYVCVGGKGSSGSSTYSVNGGYNGGGNGRAAGEDRVGVGGGGGATHIAKGTTNRGVLANYKNYQNEVLIVAGGGGGYSYKTKTTAYNRGGGAGGGTTGGGGSFGQGYDYGAAYANGCPGGGGGWSGGGSMGVGGTGYIGGVPTFTVAGVNYPSSTVSGQRDGNGYATITYMAKNVLFNFNGTEITELIYNGTAITSLTFDGTKIF